MLSPREKRLLAIILAILGTYLGYQVLQRLFFQPIVDRQLRLQALQQTLKRQRLERLRILQQQDRWIAWQEKSLPDDPQRAQSLYHEFLLELVNQSGLEEPSVNTMPPAPQEDAFTRYPYTIRGRGRLENIVRLLQGLASVDLLHQIRQLNVRRRGEQLEVELRVEAVSLQGADSVTGPLAPASDGGDATSSPLLADNPFMPYRPPEPTEPEEEPEPEIDPNQFVYFVGCVSVGDDCEAWFYDRLNNRLYRLRAGETLEAGTVRGRIIEVGDDGVVIEWEGRRYRLQLGQNLTQLEPVASRPVSPSTLISQRPDNVMLPAEERRGREP